MHRLQHRHNDRHTSNRTNRRLLEFDGRHGIRGSVHDSIHDSNGYVFSGVRHCRPIQTFAYTDLAATRSSRNMAPRDSANVFARVRSTATARDATDTQESEAAKATGAVAACAKSPRRPWDICRRGFLRISWRIDVEQPFNVGDIVRAKCGGPILLVTKTKSMIDDFVVVFWFDANNVGHTENLPASGLKAEWTPRKS
jgi:uncharacterized protein YodC (DUF2158 family)